MGIPSFFRWLAERYPLICESQDITSSEKGEAFRLLKSEDKFNSPYDTLKHSFSPPEGFDNLFLDVNGIVHNCSHSVVDLCQNITCEEDIFVSIFQNIINLVNIVKPRKLLYLAVDGVAPRAKIIQQRERRFRSAADSTQQQLILESLKDIGDEQIKTSEEPEFKFDPIQITPGTAFMERLTTRLQFFAVKMINENEQWRHLKIVVSGSEVPGEGEHKIMEYIRNDKARRHREYEQGLMKQSNTFNLNPCESHCVYGLDADLIILSLATHEPYICLLREQVVFGHMKNSSKLRMMVNMNSYILLHIGILREYLLIDLIEDQTLRSDPNIMDRVVDDFVFLSMFVGNDFLPHLMLANIPEGGFNHMLQIYREYLDESLRKVPTNTSRGNNQGCRLLQEVWLTSNCGEVNYDNLVKFLTKWAKYENRKIQNYLTNEVVDKINPKHQNGNTNKVVSANSNRVVINHSLNETENKKPTITVIDVKNCKIETDLSDFNSKFPSEPKTLLDYKKRFYHAKMGISSQLIKYEEGRVNTVDDVAREYLVGLQWILFYYYRGVPSWNWYLRCKYPPFVHDLLLFMKKLRPDHPPMSHPMYTREPLLTAVLKINFQKGKPITPYQQLMMVLPPQSAHFLPTVFSKLITDHESPLHKYYPLHFDVDMDNTNVPWGGITLIPVVPYRELVENMNKALNMNEKLNNHTNHEKENGHSNERKRECGEAEADLELNYQCSGMLTEEEKDRNKFGLARIYSYDQKVNKAVESPFKVFEDIKDSKVLCTPFFNPSLKTQHFPNILLPTSMTSQGVTLLHNMWFPSLNNLPFKTISKRGVDVFNNKSRHPSVYLNVFQKLNNNTLANLIKCTSTSHISVGYPYKHFGKIKSIHTPYVKYEEKKLASSNPKELKETITKLDTTLDKMGVIVGYKTTMINQNPKIIDRNSQVLLRLFQKVQGGGALPSQKVLNETRLVGLDHLCENVVVKYTVLDKNLQETNLTKEVFLPMVTFIDKRTTISNLIVTPKDDEHALLNKEMLSLKEEIKTNELLYGKYGKPKIKAVCMMEGSMYGRVGEVETVGQTFDTVSAIFKMPNIKLTVGETSLKDFKKFINLQEKLANHKIKWYTFERACKETETPPDVLKVICRNLVVGEAREDVGMNLVYYDREQEMPMCLPGYTQLTPTYLFEVEPALMVQYSADCIELIKEYKEKFPELFEYLENSENAHQKKTIDANEVYPNLSQEQANYKVYQIAKYCQGKPFKRLKLTQGNYTCMTTKQIEILIEHQNEVNREKHESSKGPDDVKIVRVHHIKNLHIPAFNTSAIKLDLNKVFLGQEVVYISHAEKVPIGTRGIVVGIYPNKSNKQEENKDELNNTSEHVQKGEENDNSKMLLEIVLEEDVLSATDLFGRCKKMRGIFVSATEVLLLYHQDLLNVDVYSSLYSQFDRNNSRFISYA